MVLILNVWKCTPTTSDGVNFAKDYQKDSYNKRIYIEITIDDKNILGNKKDTPTFLNVEF